MWYNKFVGDGYMELLSNIIGSLVDVYINSKIKSLTNRYLIHGLKEDLKQITINYEKEDEMNIVSSGKFCR